MAVVTLTWSEILQAAIAGCFRQTQDLKERKHDRYSCAPAEGFQRHVEGALGEIALAKSLQVFWSASVGDRKADDVGPFQVRATSHANGRLLLHPSDADEKAFILARLHALPQIALVGFIYGRDGKAQRFWGDASGKMRSPCFIVPDEFLSDMNLLNLQQTRTPLDGN